MFEKCKKCPLPGTIDGIRTQKDVGRSALSNARLAQSPTEAKPYLDIADGASNELKVLNASLKSFLEQWGYCDDCHLK